MKALAERVDERYWARVFDLDYDAMFMAAAAKNCSCDEAPMGDGSASYAELLSFIESERDLPD